jgi:hypothetical protein
VRGDYVVAVMATVLALAAGGAQAAETTDTAQRASASLDFRIRIPTVLQMKTIEQRPVLDVPAARSDGHVVTVEAARTFEVLCNLKSYELRFDITDPAVVAVEIEGLDHSVRVTREGTSVHFAVLAPADRRVRRTLTYRIEMAQGARPGPRAMPVAVSLKSV